jgi:hypothetical protein
MHMTDICQDATPELLQVKAYSPAKVALVTPKYPLTAEELRSIRHPGDTVTTGTRYEVKLIEDGEGRRLFLSQPLPTTDKNVRVHFSVRTTRN